MAHGPDEPREDRALDLSTETLHDLEPSDDQTALIVGGCEGDVSNWAEGMLTFPVPIPTSRFEALVGQTGEWVLTAKVTAHVSVREDGKLLLRSLNQEFLDPRAE